MFDSSIYASRRQALMLQLEPGDVAIIATAPEVMRNRDCDFPYRHDSNFYYLTGFKEPQAWLVLTGQGQSMLFCRPKDPSREIWDGLRLGVEQAAATLGVDLAYSVERLNEIMPQLLSNTARVWYQYDSMTPVAASLNNWITEIKQKVRSGVAAPSQQNDLSILLDEMRLIKDEQELAIIARSCEISAQAHILAMQKAAQMSKAKQTLREYHLEAELLQHFRTNGAEFTAYNSIVGAGANACILHYRAGDALINNGDLVLIDAGCEFGSYASDITRTFPANGKFSGPQKAIYDIVLAAEEAAIALIKPGIRYEQLHECTTSIISQGLLDLGLLNKAKVGGLDDVLANRSYSQFFMHSTGHWMGLDVHDVGSYTQPMAKLSATASGNQAKRLDRILQPNMVFTVEPGIYIHPAADVAEQYWNIGVRIEDNVAVTTTAARLLTRTVPVNSTEIEDIMR